MPHRFALALLVALAGGSPSLAAQDVEQRVPGTRDGIRLVTQFDGLGHGFAGPHGRVALRNPSDNALAVGPRHVVQTVNSQLAIFTRTGRSTFS